LLPWKRDGDAGRGFEAFFGVSVDRVSDFFSGVSFIIIVCPCLGQEI
jgi:hypothetical protein